MTKNILALLILTSAFAVQSYGQYEGSEIKQNRFITYGNATLYFPADRAQFTFYVKGEASTLKDALDIAANRVARIGAKLKTIGISEKQLQTSNFNSAENLEGKSWWTSSKDFAAAFQVTVTIDSFGLLEPGIAALANEPVESLSNLTFILKNDQEKLLSAYKAAAEDARQKANLVAETLGATISRVLFVEDNSPGSNSTEVLALRAVGPYVFSGKQFPVHSRLRVVFEFGYKK